MFRKCLFGEMVVSQDTNPVLCNFFPKYALSVFKLWEEIFYFASFVSKPLSDQFNYNDSLIISHYLCQYCLSPSDGQFLFKAAYLLLFLCLHGNQTGDYRLSSFQINSTVWIYILSNLRAHSRDVRAVKCSFFQQFKRDT